MSYLSVYYADFFFFKQKTAYEIGQWLEFRRVLFRSSPYGQKQLDEAKHTCDLTPADNTYVYLDHAHMGVGGDDSWSPSTHKAFLLEKKAYRYHLSLSALKASAENC